MKKVYLDNAATTPLRPEIILEMTKSLQEDFGNPSSSHSFGRSAKNIIELSRKSIAKQLNASPQEIIFTSGGTESNNWVLQDAVRHMSIKRIISSRIEHHAVLHVLEYLKKEYKIQIDYVRVNPNGQIDLLDLAELLAVSIPTLVSLMHVNNEIGTISDVAKIGALCKQYGALFHTDAVQSVGKTEIDLNLLPVDFLSASAHKFHGPKGVGFLYIRKGLQLNRFFYGGEQEKGLRAGTESVHNIAAMGKALEISYANLNAERQHILALKKYFIAQCNQHFPGVKINGDAESFYNIANVLLPFDEDKTTMILFNLDMKGIAVSRGSACQSGSVTPSHVLAEILDGKDLSKPSLRVSFSHYNSQEDIDYLISALKSL